MRVSENPSILPLSHIAYSYGILMFETLTRKRAYSNIEGKEVFEIMYDVAMNVREQPLLFVNKIEESWRALFSC